MATMVNNEAVATGQRLRRAQRAAPVVVLVPSGAARRNEMIGNRGCGAEEGDGEREARSHVFPY